MKNIEKDLRKIPDLEYFRNVNFSQLTTVKCGGKTPLLLCPRTLLQLKAVICLLRANNVNFEILGNGSNCLAQDGVYNGAIVRQKYLLTPVNFLPQERFANTFSAVVPASIPLPYLSFLAEKHGLSGLEFARTLPAQLGGAVVGNCGCCGSEISSVVGKVYATNGFDDREFTHKECNFGYRNSAFANNGYVIHSVEIMLTQCTPQRIAQKTAQITANKRRTQPLGQRTFGSTFKRDNGIIPPLLIKDCNLTGARVGGAYVSQKHCGFIVNDGTATSTDVAQLIKLIQDKVLERFGVLLTPEVRFIGEFDVFG